MSLKQELGINGETRDLGREFDMHEFKGYTIAEIKNIKDALKDIKESLDKHEKLYNENCMACKKDIHEKIRGCQDDIKDLNAFKNKVMGIAALAGIAAGTLLNLFLGILSRLGDFFK